MLHTAKYLVCLLILLCTGMLAVQQSLAPAQTSAAPPTTADSCAAPEMAWQNLFVFPATEDEAKSYWMVNTDDVLQEFIRLANAKKLDVTLANEFLKNPKLTEAIGKKVESFIIRYNPCNQQGSIDFAEAATPEAPITGKDVVDIAKVAIANGPTHTNNFSRRPTEEDGEPQERGHSSGRAYIGCIIGGAAAAGALVLVNPLVAKLAAGPACALMSRILGGRGSSVFKVGGSSRQPKIYKNSGAFNMDRKDWWRDF